MNVLENYENYELLLKIWDDQNMNTFEDFLKFYNNLDVGPMVKGVVKLQDFYKDMRIDIFKTAISVPGIARQMVFKYAKDHGAYFSLIDKKNSDLYFTLISNIIGGPSVIFKRYAEKDKTVIRDGDQLCKKIVGFDSNALYLWAFGQEFPVGSFIRRKRENNFKPEIRDSYEMMYFWMDFIAMKRNIHILHKRNSGKEKRSGRYFADGYNCETNTIFQFDGCYFHGHENCKISSKIKSENWKKKAPILRERTEKRNQYYRKLGYKLECMTECRFMEMVEQSNELKEFIKERRTAFFKIHSNEISETDILRGVKEGLLFGMVEVDITTPDEWSTDFQSEMNPQEYFSEMSPIFCNVEVPFESIGKHMQDYAKKSGMSTNPRKLLVGGMKASKLLLATPLLKWYLEHGMKVTKVHQVIEYNSMKCFQKFTEKVTTSRRQGDSHKDLSIIGDLFKLLGNSAYGSTIMNKLTHCNVQYAASETEACLMANNNLFKSMTQLSPDYAFYEVESHKNKIRLDLPIQIGFFILQYAKLKLLSFYYDCIDKLVPRSKFEVLQCDTDSLYFSIAGDSLSDGVKPELKTDFELLLNGYCSDINIDPDKHWFPRTCCEKHAKYDSREPGIFKLEYSGECFYGLCSKTYIVTNPSHCKFSTKGLSKNRITNPLELFQNSLNQQTSHSSTNVGFVSKKNSIFTYEQQRAGISYFYIKREVQADGITTKPLDLVLQPITSKFARP